MPYELCTRSLALGTGLVARNRIYFAPMGIDDAAPGGAISEGMRAFYRDVIAGGVGLVVLGNSAVDADTRLHARGLCLFEPCHAEALAPLIEHGAQRCCPIVVQLQHYGAQGSTALTGRPLLSPSGVASPRARAHDPGYRLRVMDKDDLASVVAQFARGAGLALAAGAQMVQLQASNGYLLGSFLSPLTNRRRDDYGGSDAGRSRLLLEILDAIDRVSGGRMRVSVRLGIDDRIEGGARPELVAGIVKQLEAHGVAFLSCSICVAETFSELVSPSDATVRDLHAGVAFVRGLTRMPVGFAGRIRSLDDAEHVLASGVSDMVGMTRAIYADNAIVAKSLAGRTASVNACRFDGHCFRDKSNPEAERVFCCVNPAYLRPTHIRYEARS